MKRPLFKLNPVTAKRLRRFRSSRRSAWSLRLLAAMYAASLAAELLCNDAPLVVRCDGRYYFPFIRYYPEDAFTGSGRNTRPDYKRLRREAAFRRPGNFMRFAPVPYGPNEIIEENSLAVERPVTVRLRPSPRVGSARVGPDFSVRRSTACGFFFDTNDAAVAGLALGNHWPLPPELEAAVRRRFANRTAPRFSVTLKSRHDPPRRADLSLAAFSVRARPPETVLLTFREPEDETAGTRRIVFSENGEPAGEKDRAALLALPVPARERLGNLARRRRDGPVETATLAIEDREWHARFDREDIRWPFRPVPGHWLGIDAAGRDVLARILYGFRFSMTFGILMVATAVGIGIALGAFQGYYGGAVDILGQRFTEIWGALPFLYVMILLGHVFPGRYRFLLLLSCYGVFNWIGVSYYMRAEFLRLRRQPFVEAAKCTGLRAPRIIFKHILPNALVPVITLAPFSLVGAVYALSALDYLGFGLPPPTPSWGELLAQAQSYRWAWWLIVYPFLALFVVMLLGVFVGEGVRNAFDPRPFSKME